MVELCKGQVWDIEAMLPTCHAPLEDPLVEPGSSLEGCVQVSHAVKHRDR